MNDDALRERLRARIREILVRNAKIESDLRRERTPLEGDWDENAILLENDQVLEALDADNRAHVAQLRAALGRLDDGTYGRCMRCDGKIAPARLEAMPEVTVCIGCARDAEAAQRTRR
ncbi:TraR/DksA C4-type zinc finger protein [Candidatus Binatia bacterium]|jgi:RNA polymerase-binding transcription factor DksA|nr:TraR/DksA C4-type zinc finger protein [Candidatus Binatia bacterium]